MAVGSRGWPDGASKIRTVARQSDDEDGDGGESCIARAWASKQQDANACSRRRRRVEGEMREGECNRANDRQAASEAHAGSARRNETRTSERALQSKGQSTAGPARHHRRARESLGRLRDRRGPWHPDDMDARDGTRHTGRNARNRRRRAVRIWKCRGRDTTRRRIHSTSRQNIFYPTQKRSRTPRANLVAGELVRGRGRRVMAHPHPFLTLNVVLC